MTYFLRFIFCSLFFYEGLPTRKNVKHLLIACGGRRCHWTAWSWGCRQLWVPDLTATKLGSPTRSVPVLNNGNISPSLYWSFFVMKHKSATQTVSLKSNIQTCCNPKTDLLVSTCKEMMEGTTKACFLELNCWVCTWAEDLVRRNAAIPNMGCSPTLSQPRCFRQCLGLLAPHCVMVRSTNIACHVFKAEASVR